MKAFYQKFVKRENYYSSLSENHYLGHIMRRRNTKTDYKRKKRWPEKTPKFVFQRHMSLVWSRMDRYVLEQ